MNTNPQSYDDLARDVIRNYVRSAVIIDDQWPGPELGETVPEEPPDESRQVVDEIPDVATGDIGDLEDLPPIRPVDNMEDARLLIDLQQSLLAEGLIACGFRYTRTAREKAIELARRADIVVLDWHLFGDDGADALEILRGLLGNELRFICIFTGHGLVAEVRHVLDEQLGNLAQGSEEADLCIGNLVIAIRNKEGIDQETPEFTVGPDKLLSAACSGLASKYNGLLQLAVLELTQRHRQQLPAILERFDKSVDTAVLLEAGEERSPVGQSGAFLGVLVDEWRAHLEQEHSKLLVLGPTGRRLFGAQLAEHLRDLSEADMESALVQSKVKSAKAFAKKSKSANGQEQLFDWLARGCEGTIPALHGGSFRRDDGLLAGWGALRAISGAVTQDPVSPLLRLDALFHQQFELPANLTQGTVVGIRHGTEREGDEFFLCITPLCDTDRPDSFAHLFTFLRTKTVQRGSILEKGNGLACYCVVELSDGSFACLEVLLKQRVVLRIRDPKFDTDGIVRGRLTLGFSETEGTLESAASNVALYRTAQLRSEHAFSIAAAAAADSARVGVDRSELIRSRLS